MYRIIDIVTDKIVTDKIVTDKHGDNRVYDRHSLQD